MILRELQQGDEQLLYRLFSEERMDFIDIPLTSPSAFGKWLNEVMASELLGFAIARIILDWDQRVAGMILLTNVDPDGKAAEMGTCIGKPFRGTGLNAPAKEALLHHAFQQLRLAVIILITAENNIASQKALAKLPYISVPSAEKYASLQKQREFLCGKKLCVYEVRKEDFYLASLS
jgi:RimJ/RimL family protein N-acetyltransferase